MKRFAHVIAIGTLAAGCGFQANLTGGATSPTGGDSSTQKMQAASTAESSPAPATAYRTIKVPNLADMPVAEAKKTLRRAGFSGTISIEENAGCGFERPISGRAVCHTRPWPGNPINRHITLLLSGPEKGSDRIGPYARVPNVLGWARERAVAHLAKLGFKKFKVDTTFKPRNKKQNIDCRPGLVCFQRPLPGVKRHFKRDGLLTVGETP